MKETKTPSRTERLKTWAASVQHTAHELEKSARQAAFHRKPGVSFAETGDGASPPEPAPSKGARVRAWAASASAELSAMAHLTLGKGKEASAPEGDLEAVPGYALLGHLGSGAFARVEKARGSEGGETRALKIFDVHALRRKRTMARVDGNIRITTAFDKVAAEVAIMEGLEPHAHVVALYDSFDDAGTDRFFMVLEYCGRGAVMTYDGESQQFSCAVSKGAMDGGRAARYVAEIGSGLAYLHASHVAHRDLKPDNVLLTDGDVCKIADFGVAHAFGSSLGGDDGPDTLDADAHLQGHALAARLRRVDRSASLGQIAVTEGTYGYWAPEMMAVVTPGQGPRTFNAFACDAWALGVCYYNFLTRASPFIPDSLDDLFDQISAGDVQVPPSVRGDARRLLLALLEVDVTKRATCGDLLEDAFLRSSLPRPRLAKVGGALRLPEAATP